MFKPKKYLGQNFLKNDAIASKIVQAAEIKPNDLVLEIGPGLGILTEKLIGTGAAIIAVEKDYDLITKLKRNTGEPKNLKIVHQDALWFDLANLKSYKVVANIPYNITSPLIRKFLENDNKPTLMILMVQKEVAERITAKPGSSSRGLLTIIVEFYAEAEILFEISRQEFYPVPKVDSAVVKIKPTFPHFVGAEELVQPEIFFKIVKAGFSAKRRQIHNSLAATLRLDQKIMKDILSKANTDPMARAEDLTLQNWLNLYHELKDKLGKD